MAWGTTVNDGGAKTVRCYFGSTQLTTNISLSLSQYWVVEGMVIRTGASSQEAYAMLNSSGGGKTILRSTPAEDLTASVTIKCTADATNDNDIVQTGMVVETLN